jgi:hypothetical protein
VIQNLFSKWLPKTTPAIFLFSFFLSSAQDTISVRYGDLINEVRINKSLQVLTSDSLEGRETGKTGQKKAASFIASQFESFGLKPISHGTWLQHHPISVLNNVGKNIEVNQQYFLFMKDYFFLPGLQDTLIILDTIIFAGYGITDTEYDDYKKINVYGKAVMFFDGRPSEKRKKFPGLTEDWNKKFALIYEKRPAVVFIISDSLDRIIDSLTYGNRTEELCRLNTLPSAIPIIFISQEMARTFLPEHDEEMLDKAKSFIDRKNKPRSFVATTSGFIHIVKDTRQLEGENVIGYLEGSDRKDEVIVITAHYDHLGKKDSLIYHGADDNGSGTAAVIELAGVFAKAKKDGHGPRRSMLFMTVSGEEKHLLGSSYYVEHPLVPLVKTVADLNIDMIGRSDEKHDSLSIRDYVYIIGSDKLSTELHAINERANATYTKLDLDYTYNKPDDPNRFYYRSDHYNFAKNKIPIVFYFNGTHSDYHKPTDTIDKIDFSLLVKRTRLVFFTAWELANRNDRIKVDVKKTDSEK